MVSIDGNGRANAIEEKPARPKPNWAATGVIFFHDARSCDIAAKIKPSAHGELQITAVNQAYLKMANCTSN